MLGMYLIDRTGRRKLLKIGSIGYIISLTMIAISFIYNWEGVFVPLFLFLFIASHAIGQGSIIWVFIAEIFPIKSTGSFFTTGNATYIFLIMAILIGLVNKDNSIEKKF